MPSLFGQIERITFRNDENGYTVAKMKVEAGPEPVTLVGFLPETIPGETLELTGQWVNHAKFGPQFSVEQCRSIPPTTLAGIEKYLGSGFIKGIGPATAKTIVARFGERTLDIIEKEPQRLREIPKLGEKKVKWIVDAWASQRGIRDVMIFLQGHGVTPAFAVRIYKQYGKDAVARVQENPYRIAEEVHGIGFMTADRIAGQLGVDKNSPERARAGILHLLQTLSEEGHLYYPYDKLIEKCTGLLSLDRDIVLKGFSELFEAHRIVIADLNTPEEPYKPNHKAIYLATLYAAENTGAERIRTLLATPASVRISDAGALLAQTESQLKLELAGEQRRAVVAALSEKVFLLTGGPGTGKTTIVRAVIAAFQPRSGRIALAAPTGRAAKRLSESTGLPACTLHRLLEFDPGIMGFRRHRDRPLETDLVIVDEASMMDAVLFAQLLNAVPDAARLVFVGDKSQLPPVGPGNPFRDLLASQGIPSVTLDKIFRQAEGSLIIRNAHRINRGEFPETHFSKDQDFFFIEKEEPEAVQAALLELAVNRIPAQYGLDPLRDIQVITPMHKGVIGSEQLNAALQNALNPSGRALQKGERRFREKDKVMQVRNNYDKEVFNGDIGRLERIDTEEQSLAVRFDDRRVEYDFDELDELMLAYSITVHKSQGSEYPCVLMPIHTTHAIMMQRNLLYTGLTRAKKLAILVGTKKAFWLAVRNDKTAHRYTLLAKKLSANH
ncbi:MAG: ATP-dependent RecD-like DNA helicase [Fibrobacterota bacterium]